MISDLLGHVVECQVEIDGDIGLAIQIAEDSLKRDRSSLNMREISEIRQTKYCTGLRYCASVTST